MNAIKEILRSYNRAAFLIGNGPNLAAKIIPSWKDLINSISDHPINFELKGLSNTEIYDLVEINSEDHTIIKGRVVEALELKSAYKLEIHKRLMLLALNRELPVLTTNFDQAFETSINAELFRTDSRGFTRFYPWKNYYGFKQHDLPTDGFGIWKIQGDVRYKDSIRLGLTDYMGSVERARRLIHNGDDRLFGGKREKRWQGRQT